MTVREVYLESAAVTCVFFGHPALAACWEAPSALARLRVGALAAHLAGQVTQVPPVLDAAVVDACVPLVEHWGRSSWTDGDLDSEVNTYIRRAAGEAAGAGAAAVRAGSSAAVAQLRQRLAGEPAARVIQLPWGPWALTLDDLLTTRLVELAVHCDDLAVSLGVEPPPLPPACLETAVGELSQLAARRHGPAAVIRALSRRERAPRTIAAL
jgi:hypothetical protein